jgi:hypothetical protein
MPPASVAQPPGQDSAVGTFTVSGIEAVLDAHSGPSGENPGGRFVVSFQEFEVGCLQVSGNTAVIGTNSASPFQRFSALLQVVDGPVDTFDVLRTSTVVFGPEDCPPAPQPPQRPLAISSGDIVVTDAQPFPTSKDQCKNGGWRNFGDTFKNQGDCVSFVATGGKNPPAGP